MDKTISLLSKDKKHLWHPFTQSKLMRDPLLFVRAKGSYLFTEDNTGYLDGISSWWVNLHGHCHPYLIEAITAQLHKLEHVLFTDYCHPPSIEYAEKLLQTLPSNFTRVFYSDNGSTAVESALKMAVQYWKNQNIPHIVV